MTTVISKLAALFGVGIVLIAGYLLVWIVSTYDILGEVHFGYYGDFYTVKHALEETGCINSMEYSRHEDLTLEDFHFRVRTKSGKVVRIWFDEFRGNVSAICSAPKGLLIVHPRASNVLDQFCNLEMIAERLRNRYAEKVDLKTILCNIDELAPFFESNYEKDSIPRVAWNPKTPRRFSKYLRLEVVDETINDGGWIETPIAFAQ